MKRHFGRYGKLTDCVIMQDKVTGKFRGFGFVTFENPNVVGHVLAEAHMIEGKIVRDSLFCDELIAYLNSRLTAREHTHAILIHS